MSERRRSLRRSISGRSRYSRLSNASGFLNADSNAIDDGEEPGWWKNLENTSAPMRASMRFSIAQDSEAVLDPDSNVNLSQTRDKWWDYLDPSRSPHVVLSHLGSRTTPQKKVVEDTDKELSRTSLAEKSIRKKKPQLLRKTRKSLGDKAFAKVLETTDDASEIELVHGKQKNTQDSSEGSMLSAHKISIKKARPLKKSQRKLRERQASPISYASSGEDTSKLSAMEAEAVHVNDQNEDQPDENNTVLSEHELSVKKHRGLLFRRSPRLMKDTDIEGILASDEESVSENIGTVSRANADNPQLEDSPTQQSEHSKKDKSLTKNTEKLMRTSSMREEQLHTEERSSRSSQRIMGGKISEAMFASEEESVSSLNLQIVSDRDIRKTRSAGHPTLENEDPKKHSGLAKTMEKSNQTSNKSKDELHVNEKSSGKQHISEDRNVARSSPNTATGKEDSELFEVSTKEDRIRKKRTLLKNQRKSLGGDAFAQVLETSSDTTEPEPDYHINRRRTQNKSDRTSLFEHKHSIKKVRPLRNLQHKVTGNKDSSALSVLGDEQDSETNITQTQSTHLSEQIRDKQNINDESLRKDNKTPIKKGIRSLVRNTQSGQRNLSIEGVPGLSKENSSRVTRSQSFESVHRSTEENASENLQVTTNIDADKLHSVDNVRQQNENTSQRKSLSRNTKVLNALGSMRENQSQMPDGNKSVQKSSSNQNNFLSSTLSGEEKNMPKSQQAVAVDAEVPKNSQSIFDRKKMKEIKKALEEVTRKELASMKDTKIDTYFRPIATSRQTTTTTSRNVVQSKLKKKQSQKPLKSVDKAYIVNGQVYKRPRLPRPKKWVTDRLYRHLWKCLESRYNIKTRVRSEQFVLELTEAVELITRRKKYDNYKKDLEALIKDMARLGIVKCRNDFYHFCQDFLPYDFRLKAVPMILPGNVSNVPYDPETLNAPILGIQ